MMTDHRDIELKFIVPPERIAGIRHEMRVAGSSLHHLEARYFDTANGALARRGVAMCLRTEDERWVQSVTARDELRGRARWVHELVLPASASDKALSVDPARHDGTAAGLVLQSLLGGLVEPLQERYRTKIKRWKCSLAVNQSCVDLSLDEGTLRSGRKSNHMCEMTFKLHSGEADALALVCREWIGRHGIWLVQESIAMQGERLRNGATALLVARAAPSSVQQGQSGIAMMRSVLRDCLAHALPNAAAVAAGSTDAEHVHQLRVGLRRLRTALRELHGLAPGGEWTTWETPLAATFRALGEVRDRQIVVAALSPQLAAVGATDVPWLQIDVREDLPSMVKNVAFQAALASALVYALTEGEEAQGQTESPRRWVKKRLKALHGELLKDAKRFRTLRLDSQHRVRKRLKRMRYLTEFARPLFGAEKVGRYLAIMRPAQDALGLHNDYAVALALLDPGALSRGERHAAIASTWLRKKLKQSARKSQDALLELKGAPSFWKGRSK